MQDRTAKRPVRMCVGCRGRADKSDLLRVAVVSDEVRAGTPSLVPDPRGRLPGRGAYVHHDLGCLDLAERRRGFQRAFRLAGPFDAGVVRRWLEQRELPGREADRAVGDQAKGDMT